MTDRRSRYRGAALLIGAVCLGWAWDFALGGGWVHAAAWSAALVLVAGISLLAARAAGPAPAPTESPLTEGSAGQRPEAAHAISIRPAVAEDLPELIEVEVAADKLFEVAGYGKTPGPATIDELVGARLLLVAAPRTAEQPQATGAAPPRSPVGQPSATGAATEQRPIGYLRLEVVDGQAHIEGLSVRPKWMRRGIGTALVSAASEWAAEQGFEQLTLCTFAEVPWNAPFYARQGFIEFAVPGTELQALRDREVSSGLDAMGRRCVMRKPLVSAAVAEKLPID